MHEWAHLFNFLIFWISQYCFFLTFFMATFLDWRCKLRYSSQWLVNWTFISNFNSFSFLDCSKSCWKEQSLSIEIWDTLLYFHHGTGWNLNFCIHVLICGNLLATYTYPLRKMLWYANFWSLILIHHKRVSSQNQQLKDGNLASTEGIGKRAVQAASTMSATSKQFSGILVFAILFADSLLNRGEKL